MDADHDAYHPYKDSINYHQRGRRSPSLAGSSS